MKKDRTDEVVRKFYYAIKEKKPKKLTLSDYLNFRLMQIVYKKLEFMSPYDYKYWKEKGWFEKDAKYFCGNIKSNIFKDSIARLFAWIFRRQMDKAFAKKQ